MYQAALGGYVSASIGSVLNDSPVYYEPGSNIMYPLEFEIPQCDVFYILIRKRSSGVSPYETLSVSGTDVSVKDSTNGEGVPAYLTATLANPNWDDTDFTPLVLVVENNLVAGNFSSRVVAIDSFVSDKVDNTFISFKSSVSDTGRFFYFTPLYTSRLEDRNVGTAIGIESYVSVDANSDSYLLFSPHTSFNEVAEGTDGISFSYPLGSIYYKRQKSYNDEDFTFSISSYSHNFVAENVSLVNIPSYRKAAALHIDVNMHRELTAITTNAFINIETVGTLSGATDIFKINLTR
jgi:hypothetical protein